MYSPDSRIKLHMLSHLTDSILEKLIPVIGDRLAFTLERGKLHSQVVMAEAKLQLAEEANDNLCLILILLLNYSITNINELLYVLMILRNH